MINGPDFKPLKSALHHWWPQCVSAYWNDRQGAVSWVKPNGEVIRSPGKRFGAIRNGHHFKAGFSGEPSPWDHSFEAVFEKADSSFPELIEWLLGLECKHTPLRTEIRDGLLPQDVDETKLSILVECLVSLAVRSPKFRESGVSFAEHLRGPLDEAERNGLISANIMHCQRRIVDSFGTDGKFAILFTHDREFHFGDGFYHNLTSMTQNGFGARIVAPITPNVCVFFCRPSRYRTEPRLVTLMLKRDEVDFFNKAIQVYSRDMLFYRNEVPELMDYYRVGEHRVFSHPDPMKQWVQALSGVEPSRMLIDF